MTAGTSFRSSAGSSALRITTVLLACLVAACLLTASRAHAVTGPTCAASAFTVEPSCFEGGDGNLVPGAGFTDWDNTLAPRVPLPDGSGATDNMFSNGSKQQEPDEWSLITGEPNPAKSDVLRAVIATEQVAPLAGPNQVFLYGAFQTAGDSGNTAINLELNQKQTTWTNSVGEVIPERSPGDVLITYDGKGGAFIVGICKWVGNKEASSPDAGWHQINVATGLPTGTALGGGDNCTVLPATIARGAASPNQLTNNGGLPGFPATIPADTFGELTINLSAALAGAAQNQCFSFGQAWINTRSSDTVTSAMNDYVAPVNIPPTANCGVDVDKKVSTNSNGPFTDSNTASVTNNLFYELRVENTGVVALTIDNTDITDPNCDNLSAGPTRKQQSGGAVDASPVTFDPGDVWTWTCNKTALLGNFTPGGTYTNTVTVHAHFGAFTTPDATDDAVTTFKDRPSLATSATNATVGGTITDTATLTGGNNPTGTITFKVYPPSNPTCSGAGTTVSTENVVNGSATSDPFTTTTVGSYRWIATYNGDANNDAVSGACNDAGETSTVIKATPTLATNATTGVLTGQPIHDVATLTGGYNPTGTVTFKVYQPGDTTCSGTATTVSTNALSGGTATSGNYIPAAQGDYRWIATYNGDANNNTVSGPCNAPGETSAVGKHTPTLSTDATSRSIGHAVHDTATLTGGSSPTGTITFTVYGPDDANCSGPGTVVSTNAVSNGSATSDDFTPTQAGAYRWIATYNGDANNNSVSGACNDPGETSTISSPGIKIVKSGPDMAHEGDTLTFTFVVTNTGDVPISNVVVTDDKCTNFSSTIDKKTNGAADASPSTLDLDDTWTYTCTMTAPQGNSLVNTGTAKGDDPHGDPVPPSTSTHTTRIVHPAIAIAKTGPATVTAGDTITFTLTVTNPGDVELSNVKVTDDKCPSAPVVQSKTRAGAPDPSPATLDPGDTWTFTCSVPTAAGQGSLTNVARAEGTDPIGKVVAATGSHTTGITDPPQQAVLAEVVKSGVADFVSKPKKCVTKTFRLDVRGTQIAKVTFRIDGKKIKALNKPDAQGRYRLAINPLLRNDKRHRVTAEVQYVAAAKTANKTLTAFFQRCACISRRNFQIRLRKQFKQGLRSATVFVNNKRVKVIRGQKRLRAPVKLVGLPKGRVTVKINAVTVGGKRVSGTRHYLTCNKKLKGGIPKL